MLHERTPSADGLETNFAVNTLACFALTLALQPALFRAGPARVVFVSSGGQVGSPRAPLGAPRTPVRSGRIPRTGSALGVYTWHICPTARPLPRLLLLLMLGPPAQSLVAGGWTVGAAHPPERSSDDLWAPSPTPNLHPPQPHSTPNGSSWTTCRPRR